MRLKSYIIWFTILAMIIGGIFLEYLWIFAIIIIVAYFSYNIIIYYKKEKPIEKDTIICPRCIIPVNKNEKVCPQCGEEL
ncbi:MAG: hypothetical protein ACFFBZ_04770 [Promethearchaeota archaeon]